MNSKMTRNTTINNRTLKKRKTTKTKLSKQLEQEQNQRNGHHMEGFQWGGEGGKRYREEEA